MSRTEGLVRAVDNVFPAALLEDLQTLAAQQNERKQLFLFGQTTPAPLWEAASLVVEQAGVTINTAILKQYRTDDGYISQAYSPHPDPEQYHEQDIALCTLFGRADLFVVTDSGIQTVHCKVNTGVIVDPMLTHWVTPPQNPEGIRQALFFGFDQTQPESIGIC